MVPSWPRAWGEPKTRAVIRARPEDFVVRERLGFELTDEGEHVFLHLEKRQLNTVELQERVSRLSGVSLRDIGFSGMKDRNAVTRQWLSVGLAGKPEADWLDLECTGEVKVLEVRRHQRKLKRGVHLANHFILRLTDLNGDRTDLEERLTRVKSHGVPNYFGEQRFGAGGNTLNQGRHWMSSGKRKLSRTKKGLYLSALRSFLFNELLAQRVRSDSWGEVQEGDVCLLQGSRSRFVCVSVDTDIRQRSRGADIHPGLPLWGAGQSEASAEIAAQQRAELAGSAAICDFLEGAGLDLDYRSARLMADDFCWQFCDDGSLQLDFALGPGGYATAVLAELVQYNKGIVASGNGSE